MSAKLDPIMVDNLNGNNFVPKSKEIYPIADNALVRTSHVLSLIWKSLEKTGKKK